MTRELSDLTRELDRQGGSFENMDARSRRDFLRLAALAGAGVAFGCSGGGGKKSPTEPTPGPTTNVVGRLKSALDGNTGVVGTSIEFTDVNGASQTTGTGSDGSYNFTARTGSTYNVIAGNYESRRNLALDYKHAGDTIFMVPTDDRALYDRVKDVFFTTATGGLVRMPSNHLGESQPMWRIQLDPKLPDSYKDTIMDYLARSFEFTDGGVNLGGAPIEPYSGTGTVEGVLKWEIDNGIPGNGLTNPLIAGNLIRGAETRLRSGFDRAQQLRTIGHEQLAQYGAFGNSPNGGLMTGSSSNEDSRDVPMVRIAYRTETGHRPA